MLTTQVSLVTGSYRLDIRARNYRNNRHKDAAGYCCEIYRRSSCDPWWCGYCECDNKFTFCLRAASTSRDGNSGNCPLGSHVTGEIGDDSFNFGSTRIASGVPNPMTFQGSVWPVSSYIASYDILILIAIATIIWWGSIL